MIFDPYMVNRIRETVTKHKQSVTSQAVHSVCDILLMEAAERIDYLEKKVDDLEERIAIMSEDQYKSSEIRFP